jgi:hypothetical protein
LFMTFPPGRGAGVVRLVISVRANADHDQHKVSVPAEDLLIGSAAIEMKPVAAISAARLMRVTVERV